MEKIYFSIDSLPLDTWNGNDGDNSSLKGGEATEAENEILLHNLLALTSHRYVPLRRTVVLGQRGPDSFAVKRALSKAGFGKWGGWGVKNLFGPFARKNLQDFQKKHKIQVTGRYGSGSHKVLAPYFDDYGAWLMGQVDLLSPSQKKRNAIVATAMFGYANRALIHYTEGPSRMSGVRHHIKPPSVPSYEDCSSFATWCYWVADVPDPNDLGYDGQGYTGTLMNHGRAITLAEAQAGDLIFYGWNNGIPTHVAVYVGNGRVVSHGSESGPMLIDVNYRSGVSAVRSYV